MSERISARVNSLREWMRRQTPQIDAYVIPTADAHGSEYIAAHWQSREWLTGFTGSAGLAVVTPRFGPTRAIGCKRKKNCATLPSD